MRLGLISDIHGNTIALDAVLHDIAESHVDVIVCLGDLAANGPDPRGAIDRIGSLGCPVVQGNTDADLIHTPSWWLDPDAAGVPETARPVVEISQWCAGQLTDDHKHFLAGLPGTFEIDLDNGGALLAFHGSPTSATDVITDTTPPNELDQMLGDTRSSLLAGGHTHVPLIRRHGPQTIINPGSVGLPFAGYGSAGDVRVLNHGSYGVITVTDSDVEIELRETEIDPELLRQQVRDSDMPHAGWWLGLRL